MHTVLVNRKDTEKEAQKKGTHDTEKDTEKDTEQPKSSRSKQTRTYPGHSAGLQGWVPLPLLFHVNIYVNVYIYIIYIYSL